MNHEWYGLVESHFHQSIGEMWNCPGCLKVIRKMYPIYDKEKS